MTDFLDQTRGEITKRLKELEPLVDEFRRLEAAASALDGIRGSSAAAPAVIPPRRRGPGRPKKVGRPPGASSKAATLSAAAAETTGTSATTERKKPGRPPRRKKVGRPAGRPPGRPKGRAGRRKGSGTRAAEALAFVKGQPGITIPELAGKMGIKQNYLYRVLPGLEQEGKLSKQGRGWHPKS